MGGSTLTAAVFVILFVSPNSRVHFTVGTTSRYLWPIWRWAYTLGEHDRRNSAFRGTRRLAKQTTEKAVHLSVSKKNSDPEEAHPLPSCFEGPLSTVLSGLKLSLFGSSPVPEVDPMLRPCAVYLRDMVWRESSWLVFIQNRY